MSNFTKGATIVGSVIILVIIAVSLCTTSIAAGHAGIVYNRNGGVEETTLGQGWHVVSPFKRVTEYPIATETVTYENVRIGTKDGKPITTTFSFNYHIELDKLPSIFNKFRGAKASAIESGYLKSRMTEMAKEVTTKYSVLEILGEKSSEVSIQLQDKFSKDSAPIGFIIEAVTFQPPMPDEQTQKAIQAKVDAQQKLEQQKVELEQAKIIAEKARVEAKGKADAALIAAQGQAKSNEIITHSITDNLMKYKTIEKWDGVQPQVVGGGTPMIQLTPPATK